MCTHAEMERNGKWVLEGVCTDISQQLCKLYIPCFKAMEKNHVAFMLKMPHATYSTCKWH